MKHWSVPVPDYLRIKVFLDTNILCYLVDETYPPLTQFIQDISKCCCVDLISSDFCQMEFTGIRKREHYLRLMIEHSKSQNKVINVSSLLKYHNQFECEEIKFEEVIDEIETNVKSDLERIVSDFGLSFTAMNSQTSSLAREICLKSKISKEDSYVLASASLDYQKRVRPCLLLTNDSDFGKWFKEKETNLDRLFVSYETVSPCVIDIRDVWGCNLHNSIIPKQKIIVELKKILQLHNSTTFIGMSFRPQEKFINDFPNIFALRARNTIYQNRYICVFSSDLQSFINIPNKASFFHKNSLVEDGSTFTQHSEDMVTLLIDNVDDVYADGDYQEILKMLQQLDNMAFYMDE